MEYLALIAGLLVIGLALWSHYTKAGAAEVASLIAEIRSDVANIKAKLGLK